MEIQEPSNLDHMTQFYFIEFRSDVEFFKWVPTVDTDSIRQLLYGVKIFVNIESKANPDLA